MSLLEKLRTKTAKLTAAIGLGLMSVYGLPRLQADKLVETGTYNNGNYTITVTDNNTVEHYWEDNAHQNWTLDTYLKTINREAVLKRLEQEKTMLDKAEEVVSELGIESPLPEDFSLSKGVEIFSPEYDLDFQNWDVYLHQSGSFIGGAKTYFAKIINFVPSNIPKITDMELKETPEGILCSVQAIDETNYDKIKEQVEAELPFWKLRIQFPPENKDLTCYLGPTKLPDLTYCYTTTNLETNESILRSIVEPSILLPNENYKVDTKVIDDAGNESSLFSKTLSLEEKPTLEETTIRTQAETLAKELITQHFSDWEPTEPPAKTNIQFRKLDLLQEDLNQDGEIELLFFAYYDNGPEGKYCVGDSIDGTLIWIGDNKLTPFFSEFSLVDEYSIYDCTGDGNKEISFRFWAPHSNDDYGLIYFREKGYCCVFAINDEPYWYGSLSSYDTERNIYKPHDLIINSDNYKSRDITVKDEKAKTLFHLLEKAHKGNKISINSIEELFE